MKNILIYADGTTKDPGVELNGDRFVEPYVSPEGDFYVRIFEMSLARRKGNPVDMLTRVGIERDLVLHKTAAEAAEDAANLRSLVIREIFDE